MSAWSGEESYWKKKKKTTPYTYEVKKDHFQQQVALSPQPPTHLFIHFYSTSTYWVSHTCETAFLGLRIQWPLAQTHLWSTDFVVWCVRWHFADIMIQIPRSLATSQYLEWHIHCTPDFNKSVFITSLRDQVFSVLGKCPREWCLHPIVSCENNQYGIGKTEFTSEYMVTPIFKWPSFHSVKNVKLVYRIFWDQALYISVSSQYDGILGERCW